MTREEFLGKLPELLKNYQPAPAVLARLKDVELLMLIGPSGVGKSTLIDQLDLAYVPSDTTRPARPGEQEGIDFYFRANYEQVAEEIKAARFVQVAVDPAGDLKATRPSSYPASGYGVMPVVADVVPAFRQLGFKRTISAFIVPPSFEEWMRRMQTHHLTPEQLSRRLAEAARSLKFALADQQMNFILNDDLAAATTQLAALLDDKLDETRENKAKVAAKDNLARLEHDTAVG